MATAAELLRPLRPGLVPVPGAGQPGVCRICHSGCDPNYDQCYPCLEAASSVGADEILPISMSIDGDLLHRHLRGYKDDRSEQVRARMSLRLAALVAVFMRHHGGCVGDFDSVVLVPSATRTAFESIIQLLPSLRERYRPTLQVTGVGSKNDLNTDRFALSRTVSGERTLVLDDTFTRGPTIFSAAAALRAEGATIVGQRWAASLPDGTRMPQSRHFEPAVRPAPAAFFIVELPAKAALVCVGELKSVDFDVLVR